MKTVISASRRTDIPAYYLKWFMDGISKGQLKVKNPIYRKNSILVNLNPQKIGWIIFWSRNYKNFIKNHSFFSAYRLYFHFTIVSHHALLEKSALPVSDVLKQLECLAALYGSNRLIWRYDPIVIWADQSGIQSNFSENEFSFLCNSISDLGIRSCYFSFATPYTKYKNRIKKRYPEWILENPKINKERNVILLKLKEIAAKYKIDLFSCCNDRLLDDMIKRGACISGELLNSLVSGNRVSRAKSATRQDCGCTKSIDIGDYQMQPCFSGCIYCYANPVL